jgi:glutathione synthase/RimK-type ligase-like ATP-grasp enzyme
MAKDHWQIIKNSSTRSPVTGKVENINVADAPKEVLDAAQSAAALIGDGLYGVDLKQTEDGIYVVEINDNPSIDYGDEDMILKDELYKTILKEFIRRIAL